jgi:hypothetical protein
MLIKLFIGILIGGAIGSLMGHFGKCSSGSCPLTATPLRGAMYGAVLGALFAFSSASRQHYPLPEGGAPHIASQEALDEVIHSENPTVLFFENGEEVERMTGLRPKESYESVLDRLIEPPEPKEESNGGS